MHSLVVFAGNSNPELAGSVCRHIGIGLGDCEVKRFSDGEIQIEIRENVRGKDVFILQSTCAPVNEHLVELLLMIDAFKRSSARRVTAVIPYYGFARQD
jgi:ribose-phosphate pyrophosphokinase